MLNLTRWLRRADADSTLACQSLGDIRNRDVANWREAEYGRLRWSGQVFEIRWHDGCPLVSGGTGKGQCDVVVAAVQRRCNELAEESLHAARRGNPAVRLNGAITFARADWIPIACRHLVVYWLGRLFDSGPDGPDYSTHFTAAAVRQHLGRETENIFMDAKRLCEMRIVANADWGEHLRYRFRELEKRGETTTGYLLLTPDHAMALALRILDRDGRRVHQICFYEPSETATHVEATFEDTERMHHLSAGAFTNAALPSPPRDQRKQQQALKFSPQGDGAVDAMMWVEVGPRELAMLRSREKSAPDVPRKLSGLLPPLSADALWHLLRYGCVEALLRLAPAFRRLPDEERIAWLLYRGPRTAFFDVMCQGHPETLAAYGKLIEGLPVQARATLLQGTHRHGQSAFGYVLQHCQRNMIGPFWRLVKHQLPPDWHYSLMRGELADGSSALYHALARNDATTMRQFARETEDMPWPLFAKLMGARGPNGEPGLLAALRNAQRDSGVAESFDRVLGRLPEQACAVALEDAWRYVQSLAGQPGERPQHTAAIKRHVEKYAPSLLQPTAPTGQGIAPQPSGREESVAGTMQGGISRLLGAITGPAAKAPAPPSLPAELA